MHETWARLLLCAILWLPGAASAQSDAGGALTPPQEQGAQPPSQTLAGAQAEVMAAHRQLNADNGLLEADMTKSKTACQEKGRGCKKADAKVQSDLDQIKTDQSALDKAWAQQVSTQHSQFQAALDKRKKDQAGSEKQAANGGGSRGRRRKSSGQDLSTLSNQSVQSAPQSTIPGLIPQTSR